MVDSSTPDGQGRDISQELESAHEEGLVDVHQDALEGQHVRVQEHGQTSQLDTPAGRECTKFLILKLLSYLLVVSMA